MDGHVYKGRREDGRLLTGTGCYTADFSMPRQVYAAFLRADRAHARIEAIDIAAARAAAGVLDVLTGSDMLEAGYTRGQAFMYFDSPSGALKAPRSPALAQDRVRFVGEAVALVVAETAHAAQDAVELIDLRYDTLGAVVGAKAALEPGSRNCTTTSPVISVLISPLVTTQRSLARSPVQPASCDFGRVQSAWSPIRWSRKRPC
jgi:aerobic carbon-monoxide dehydrogenase large subunit